METSRITAKHQAIVPADVLATLGATAGDSLAWDVADGEVRVRKARAVDRAFALAVAATLDEWDSAADEEAWRGL